MKKKLLSLLISVLLVLQVTPFAFAASSKKPGVWVDFSYTALSYTSYISENGEYISDGIEINDTTPGTAALHDGGYRSDYDTIAEVLEKLTEGKLTSDDGFYTFTVDKTKPLIISIPQSSRTPYSETFNQKVNIVSKESENNVEDELCVVYPGGITIQVNYNRTNIAVNNVTFAGGLEIGDGASLILKNNTQNVSSGSTLAYTFGDAVTVGGSLTFSGNAAELGGGGTSGSVTFSENATLTVAEGGEVTIGSVAVTSESSEGPLITVENSGTLNFTTDGISSYGTITTSGTAITVENGGALTVSAGKVASTGSVPAVVVQSGGSITITEDNSLMYDVQAPDITTSSDNGQAVSLESGSAITAASGVTVTVSEENNTAGDNYVDNYGNIILAAGATVDNEELNAAVILADGTIIEGSEDEAPTVETTTNEDGKTTTNVTVPAGGSVQKQNEEKQTLAAGGSVSSTEGETKVEVSATGITLDKSSVTLYSNTTPNTVTLTATLTPDNSTDTVGWESSDTSVATVDAYGTVTAVANGTATITATAGEQSATCTVTVKTVNPNPSYSITAPSVDNGSVTVSPKYAVGGSTVTITVTPDEGYKLSSLTVISATGRELTLTDKGNGEYTFVMPASKVTVTAAFVTADTIIDPVKDCHKDGTCPASVFGDLNLNSWSHDGIHYCVDKGLMNGMTATEFAPAGTLTRGMLVTILYRHAGSPAAGARNFTDVAQGAWYTDAIAWAAENDIVNGYGDGTFGPNDPITREQMATILYRYARFQGQDVTDLANLSTYTDGNTTSDYAKAAMAWCVKNGILNGYTDGTIKPTGTATREEIATVLMRFREK